MTDTDEILRRVLQLHPKKIDLSLERIERLLSALGDPHLRLPPVVHVAGTNGKGSTIAFMRAILEAAGRRVHVYTSPHLVHFNERIRIGHTDGGHLVPDADLVEALAACEAANDGQPITFFEITTAAAFLLFAATPADYTLLEVGLGGRVDATNVVSQLAATVITPVSIDHPEFLGTTLDAIAFEKAGILKRRVPAILSLQQEAAFAVLQRQAARCRAPLTVAGQDFTMREEHGRLIFEDERGLLDLPLPKLLGRHQHQNAAAAIATLRVLEPDLPSAAFERGLLTADWPARLQRLTRGHMSALVPTEAELWLDGGHNEDGGRVLGQAMADLEERVEKPLVVVCGTLASKDTSAFLRAFKGLAQEVIAVPLDGDATGRAPADVAAAAASVGLAAAACASVEAALRFLAVRDWRVPPRILICGSLHLAGTVLRLNGTPPT